MSKDKMTLRGNGYLLQFVLHSGGVKSFVFFELVVGAVCLLFTIVTNSLIPFAFWALISLGVFGLFVSLALSPNKWAFFLESNYIFKFIQMQMEQTGDKQIGRAKIEDAKLVQPILETEGDIVTEAKEDQERALEETKK